MLGKDPDYKRLSRLDSITPLIFALLFVALLCLRWLPK